MIQENKRKNPFRICTPRLFEITQTKLRPCTLSLVSLPKPKILSLNLLFQCYNKVTLGEKIYVWSGMPTVQLTKLTTLNLKLPKVFVTDDERSIYIKQTQFDTNSLIFFCKCCHTQTVTTIALHSKAAMNCHRVLF